MAKNVDILIKLREIRDTLTPAEGRVADYILKHPEEIPGLSIVQLAGRCKTSEASVIRFCRALNFKGYRDFIVAISTTIGSISMQPLPDGHYTDVCPGDDISTIINNISLNNRRSIEDTLSVLEEAQVAKAIDLLLKSRQINFFGVAASAVVCIDAEQKFMRINKPCRACVDAHAQLTAAALMKKGDIAVLVSNSGNTDEILDVLDELQNSGAKSIAITRYSKSPLARRADCVLSISTPEISIRSGAMGSRIAMLNVVDILYAGVASAEYDKVKKYLSHTHDVLQSKHTQG